MSIRLAARWLALAGPSPPSAAAAAAAGTWTPPRALPPQTRTLYPAASQRRQKFSLNPFSAWKKKRAVPASPAEDDIDAELLDPKKRRAFLERNLQGSTEDNIFQDEIDSSSAAPGIPSSAAPSELGQRPQLTRDALSLVLDPDPRSRIRWHRKKVIQMVRKEGLLSREEKIKMSERQLRHKSPFMATSVKKLVKLSRQIAGKTIDDAIIQMNWSNKKMAAEIKYYLEEARDLAVAQRGMGLGKVNGEILDKPRKILTKDGKWIQVSDPTRIYVAESWVGRGPWRGKSLDYKARGRRGLRQHPSTSITILLKSEKTRIREYEEREAKKAAKGPWIHLPDRPIHGQRPYYTW